MPNIKKTDYAQICYERGLTYLHEKNPHIYFIDSFGFNHRVFRSVFANTLHTGSIKTVQDSVDLYFVAKLKQKFPDIEEQLSFDRFKYTGAQKYCFVECKEHGGFRTKPNWLLTRGSTCMKCGRESIKESLYLSQEDYLNKVREKFGDTYNYTSTNYISCRKDVVISCKVHGDFSVMAYRHLQGLGCPLCGEVGGYSRSEYENVCPSGSNVYLLKVYNSSETFLKIGISKDVTKRVKEISKETDYQVEILNLEFFRNAGDAWDFEKLLLKEFYEFKYKPNRKFRGQTECVKGVSESEIIKLMKCCA